MYYDLSWYSCDECEENGVNGLCERCIKKKKSLEEEKLNETPADRGFTSNGQVT